MCKTPIFIIFVVGLLPLIITYVLFLEKDIKLLEEKKLKKQAVTQAITDGLTGAFNNYYLKQQLKQLDDHSVIAILDLDNLKPLNDSYGHLAGDYVLCYLTDTIKQYIRETDILCRYGGDEFIIIFKDCTIHQAKHVANNIRQHIKEHTIPYNGHQLTTSISIGMCQTSSNRPARTAIECADKALYQAKKLGKNRIVLN